MEGTKYEPISINITDDKVMEMSNEKFTLYHDSAYLDYTIVYEALPMMFRVKPILNTTFPRLTITVVSLLETGTSHTFSGLLGRLSTTFYH